MNKLKTSKKEVKENNYLILSVGYCKLQNLLKYQNPIAYSSGVYGWACDYYDIDSVIISTGYNPLSSKNMVSNYELIKEYDDKASLIDYTLPYQVRKDKVNALLLEFIYKARQERQGK